MRLWDSQGQFVQEIKTQQSVIVSLGFSPDGQQLAIADVDNRTSSVSQWRLHKPVFPVLKTQQRYVSGLQFSPDGQQLFTVDGADVVRVWSLAGRSLPALPVRQSDLAVPQQRVVGVSLRRQTNRQANRQANQQEKADRQENTMAIITDTGRVQLYSRPGSPPTIFQAPSANSIDFSPDGQQLVTAGRQGAFLWSLTGDQQAEIAAGDVQRASFSADGTRLLIVQGGKVIGRSLTGAPDSVLIAHEGEPILGLAVSPDGQRFATSSNDNAVRMWSLDNNLLSEYRFPEAVVSVSFSPDGHYLAAGDEAGQVRFIPVETLPSLLTRGCRWLRAYPSVKAGDLAHCPEDVHSLKNQH